MPERKPVRTWYSVTGANGRLWIVDKDLQEIQDALRMDIPKEFLPYRVERHDVYEYAEVTVIDQASGIQAMLFELESHDG